MDLNQFVGELRINPKIWERIKLAPGCQPVGHYARTGFLYRPSHSVDCYEEFVEIIREFKDAARKVEDGAEIDFYSKSDPKTLG